MRARVLAHRSENVPLAASLSKGFGTNGGVLMLATDKQDRLIRRYAVPHTFSMGPDVASLGAAIASAKIHRTPELAARQARLGDIITEFDHHIATENSDTYLPIRMVAIGEEKAAINCAADILSQGYYVVPAIFPGVPKSRAALRVCLTADHKTSEIQGLCSAMKASIERNAS